MLKDYWYDGNSPYVNGLVQERRNSIANALELRLSCTNPSMCGGLTLKHRETHGCVVSTVATDALLLKHQAISILSTD